MKFVDRVKIVFNRESKRLLKVTNTEQLEERLYKMEDIYYKAKSEINKQKGKFENLSNIILEKEDRLNSVKQVAKKLKESNNEQGLRDAYEIFNKLNPEIKELNNQKEMTKVLIAKTEDKATIYKSKIDILESQIKTLKLKEEFTANVDEFKTIMNNFGEQQVDKLIDEVNENYYASTFDLEDFKDDNTIVESYMKDENYNKFVAEL